jgi:hypothetical protein
MASPVDLAIMNNISISSSFFDYEIYRTEQSLFPGCRRSKQGRPTRDSSLEEALSPAMTAARSPGDAQERED